MIYVFALPATKSVRVLFYHHGDESVYSSLHEERSRRRPRTPHSQGGGIVTQYFPIVVERESNGTFSAWVAGLLGVYAAADTAIAAKRGIRAALAAHIAHSCG